jgi:hypothetical protein
LLILITTLAIGVSTSAFAGDKRFCGYISLGKTMNIAAGAWLDKNDGVYSYGCNKAVDDAKTALKKEGVWDKFKWTKKDGYKCSSVSDDFTGSTNMCTNYMKEKKGYLIQKKGSQAATFERKP